MSDCRTFDFLQELIKENKFLGLCRNINEFSKEFLKNVMCARIAKLKVEDGKQNII